MSLRRTEWWGWVAAPLGAVLGGVATEAIDVRAAYVLAAFVSAFSWFILVAGLRHLDDALAGTRMTDR